MTHEIGQQSYTIQINEDQRAMLTAALLAYAYPACFEKDDREELDLLALMLQTLPEDEKETPKALHGFCL